MKTCCRLLVATIAAFVLAVATPVAAIIGGWGVIPDVDDDAHVQEVGAWAVAEHVKRANDGLRFGKVVSGEEQLVSGVNYRLGIVAVNLAGQNARFNAVVYEQSWTNTRRLLSFDRA
ncbi:Cysteine proteinase inhibitor 8 [Dichanthelium oligosanthes]|uniref:Cysteine proteinase inhibitor 8 n=1 Tax=Dichanthelium oligosanthes TaxID=888268 RepID=A0A1E5W8Q5_9POAL|nr:Cysteine proteinase inhibitor 8 [Dichanthelium oligosanthes]